MSQDFYQYSEKMRSYLQYLENRIKSLEQTVASLTNELALLKQKPSIHVDRIDYSFDQLKIETLEGTLNIGLNPSDLEKIEELSVNPKGPVNQNGPFYPPVDPKQMMNRSMEIEETMHQFIQLELPEFIMNKQTELGLEEDEAYITFIQEDVTKQLLTRISFYLQQQKRSDEENPAEFSKKIISSLKEEIMNGVHLFLSNIPENMKGRKGV
ncbi:spore germination protein GerPC [Niallia sp. 03133]|uniref:spore germination protein GerPC n=1 Tax=Niallia sp. 03133 TaxID=3458060 RepID=UPI004044D876